MGVLRGVNCDGAAPFLGFGEVKAPPPRDVATSGIRAYHIRHQGRMGVSYSCVATTRGGPQARPPSALDVNPIRRRLGNRKRYNADRAQMESGKLQLRGGIAAVTLRRRAQEGLI